MNFRSLQKNNYDYGKKKKNAVNGGTPIAFIVNARLIYRNTKIDIIEMNDESIREYAYSGTF